MARGPTTERHETDRHWLVVVVQLRVFPSQGEDRCRFQTRVLHTKDTGLNAIRLPEHVTSLLLESPRAQTLNRMICAVQLELRLPYLLPHPAHFRRQSTYYIIISPTATEV